MHKKVAEIAMNLESPNERDFLLDVAQKLQAEDVATTHLKKLCYSKKVTSLTWTKAFNFLRSQS